MNAISEPAKSDPSTNRFYRQHRLPGFRDYSEVDEVVARNILEREELSDGLRRFIRLERYSMPLRDESGAVVAYAEFPGTRPGASRPFGRCRQGKRGGRLV